MTYYLKLFLEISWSSIVLIFSINIFSLIISNIVDEIKITLFFLYVILFLKIFINFMSPFVIASINIHIIEIIISVIVHIIPKYPGINKSKNMTMLTSINELLIKKNI